MAVAFVWISAVSTETPYLEIAAQMVLLGGGLGLTTAPATESIMGSLSLDKAGVGSAVNDTTRELGGTLGVAVVGSVFSSIYVGALGDGEVVQTLPAEAREATEESVGAAQIVAEQVGGAGPEFLAEVSDAFLSGFGVACLVVAGIAAGGSILLPATFPPGRRMGRRRRRLTRMTNSVRVYEQC